MNPTLEIFEADYDKLVAERDKLERENWQLRQALGYPIPADKDTPNNPFRCGICDARNRSGSISELRDAAVQLLSAYNGIVTVLCLDTSQAAVRLRAALDAISAKAADRPWDRYDDEFSLTKRL